MEFLAILAGAIGTLWGLLALRRGGLLAGLLLVLLAGTCFSIPFFKVSIGPLPLSIDRIVLVLVVAQYMVWRWCGLADPKPWGPPEWVLLAFSGYLVFSTLRGDWRAEGYRAVAWLIVNYAMPVVVYLIARQARWNEPRHRWLLTALAVFGVYLAVVTLAEYLRLSWLLIPRYIATTAADPGTEFVGRGRGPLLHPIGNGIMLCVCLAATLLQWPHRRRWGRLLATAVAALLLAALFATLTRSVWMSTLLTLAIVVGFLLPPRVRWPVLGAGLIVSLALTAVFWEHILTYKRDRALDASKAAESAELRPVLAMIAWQMFLERPLLGFGYSQYQQAHLDFTSDRSTGLPLEVGRGYVAHSVVLSLLTETGLIGLALFLALNYLWCRDAWGLWRDATAPPWARQQALLLMATAGTYFLNGMFHDVSLVAMSNMLLFFMAGVTEGVRLTAARGASCGTPRVVALSLGSSAVPRLGES